MRFPAKITSSCIWVAIPISWVILHWYAWGADGPSVGRTVTWLPKFLGWVDYQIFLPMVLRFARVELCYKVIMFFDNPHPPGRKVLPSWALFIVCAGKGSPSIGEHRHCCVTFEIWGFVWGKNLSFLYPTTMKGFQSKNSLPYIKSVLRLSWVVHGPIFMGYTVNGVLFI